MSLIEKLEALESKKATAWDIADEDFSVKDGKTLARALKDNPKVESLTLRKCGPLRGAMEELAEAFKNDCNVKSLDLRRFEIPAGGAKAIAEAIKVNTSLTSLVLCEVETAPGEMAAICEAFKTNSTITNLDLKRNSEPLKSALVLADALAANSTLRAVVFSSSGPCFTPVEFMAEKGANAFAEALKSNTMLEKLDLKHNQIPFPAAQNLLESVLVKKTLREMDISYNALTGDDRDSLQQTNKTKKILTTLWVCGGSW